MFANAVASARNKRLFKLLAVALLVLVTASWHFSSLRESGASLRQALASKIQGQKQELRCDFDYPGPLRLEDLACGAENFPFPSPVFFKKVPPGSKHYKVPGTVHDLRGIRSPNSPSVPIFITFKDRVTYLLELIRSYHRHIGTPFEIVVVDDHSTYPAAVNFLERLKESGIPVISLPPHGPDVFNELYARFAAEIQGYMKTSTAPNFLWTDPDAQLDSAPYDILEVYADVIDTLGAYNVGGSLRWDDWIEELRDDTGFEHK
ncbi:hypothetical protein HKX48_002902 [Thoreauomyces humboldtii]|nr:hypothetical protein HKX48_002902 [Thoreauomyces humboldtii]